MFSERMNEFRFSEFLFPSLEREYNNAKLTGLQRGLSDNICELLRMAPKPVASTQYMFVVPVDPGDTSSNLAAVAAASIQSCLPLVPEQEGPAQGQALQRVCQSPAATTLPSQWHCLRGTTWHTAQAAQSPTPRSCLFSPPLKTQDSGSSGG